MNPLRWIRRLCRRTADPAPADAAPPRDMIAEMRLHVHALEVLDAIDLRRHSPQQVAETVGGVREVVARATKRTKSPQSHGSPRTEGVPMYTTREPVRPVARVATRQDRYSVLYCSGWDWRLGEPLEGGHDLDAAPTEAEAIAVAQRWAPVAGRMLGFRGRLYVTDPDDRLVAMVDPQYPSCPVRYAVETVESEFGVDHDAVTVIDPDRITEAT